MSKLNAKIHWDTGVVTIWGPGTFHAKEDIKALGNAKWNGALKVWEVVPAKLSRELLESRFPGLDIEEVGTAAESEQAEPELPIPQPESSSGLPPSASVSELLSLIKKRLLEAFPGKVIVRGVLSSVKQYQQRVYLELADQDTARERVSCVIWQNAESICRELTEGGFKLEEDLPVMFEARVDLSPRDGRISLSVVGIIAEYTAAKLAAERELTNARLQKEGLFGKNKELELPFLPIRLGVLTSAGGTVINDFRASLDAGRFGFELFWLSVSVQGAGAVGDVVNGLTQLGRRGDLDALLLFRGGGSPAELAVFNNYEIAKAICQSPLPVLCAIGHEKDQSSAQDVSWRHFGVPKDVGRFFAELITEYRRRFTDNSAHIADKSNRLAADTQRSLETLTDSMLKSARSFVSAREELLYRLRQSVPALTRSTLTNMTVQLTHIAKPASALGRALFDSRQKAFSYAGRRLEQLAAFMVEKAEGRLGGLELLVENARPEVQLKRGFVLVRPADSEEFVTRSALLDEDQDIYLAFHDGERRAKVSD